MALPILPLLILGGGAALLFASNMNKKRVQNWENCAVVAITQAQANAKVAEIMMWANEWRDRPNDSACDCMAACLKILWPQCAWPPPTGERQIMGTDGIKRSWNEIEAMCAGKTVKQASAEGLIVLGAMESVDATGLTSYQGPGIKGIT